MPSTKERDRLIDEAVHAGKIPGSAKATYRARFDRDPAGTRKLLASFAPALAYRMEDAAEDAALDDIMAAFGATHRRDTVAAASEAEVVVEITARAFGLAAGGRS